MSQYWYEFGDTTSTKKPAGIMYRNVIPAGLRINPSNVKGSSFIEVDASQVSTKLLNTPILMLERDFDEFELLVRSIQRSYHSGNTLYNGGRGIGVRCVEPASMESLPPSGLLLTIGSSNDSTNQRITRQYVLPNTDSNTGTATALPTTLNTQDLRARPVLTRIKVTNNTIQTRHWFEDTVEPNIWHLSHSHTFIGKKVYLGLPGCNVQGVLVGYSFVSIATESDAPLSEPLTFTRSGKIDSYYAGRSIRLRSPNSGRIYDESIIALDGSWSLTEIVCETVPHFNVFIAVDDGEILIPEDLSGDGYLGGDYPDGLVKENSAPVVGTIRVVLRGAFGSSRDGFVVAEVQTALDGSWRVDNLNRAYRYDVICRLEGYEDQIHSNIAPASM